MTRGRTFHHWIAAGMAVAALLVAFCPAVVEAGQTAGIVLLEEYVTPGMEVELSGIYPHPTDDSLYFVVANRNPVYRAGEEPKLSAEHRGKLLVVNRHSGEVVKSMSLVDGEYGGIASGDGKLFVASLEPPEILVVDPDSGAIERRIAVSGPVGGLEYDRERGRLVAQLFIRFPHLAVIDPSTGATETTLWSDESAMGLAKVGGDWLCSWASGFDAKAFSELRLINQQTGKVDGRYAMDGVLTSMAPLDPRVAGVDGFISLVADRESGKTVVRRYGYRADQMSWIR